MKNYKAIILIVIMSMIVVFSSFVYVSYKYSLKNNNVQVSDGEENEENSSTPSEEEKDEPIVNGITTLETAKNESGNIVENYEFNLNGEVVNKEVIFGLENKDGTNYITGKIGDVVVYNSSISDSTLFSLSHIKETFNAYNFYSILGSDNKDYLIVKTYNEDYSNYGRYYQLYVFNSQFDLISKSITTESNGQSTRVYDGFVIDNFELNIPCAFENDAEPLYSSTIDTGKMSSFSRQYVKIDNNKIYYLYPVINTSRSGGTLEERIYTINEDKLDYIVASVYKITSVCQ